MKQNSVACAVLCTWLNNSEKFAQYRFSKTSWK